ncbi:MAG: response regulator [Cypionkella sp.]|uniref:response regulator n=1 Tax=Cypionkella sp. TaxID=2811411 RepID=UPI00262AA681|nr:response regulator [Cypionkella sp.]MDB5658386.1 response regulator [Cypionkella sp.]
MTLLRFLLPGDSDAAAQIQNQLQVLKRLEPARLLSMSAAFGLMAIFLPLWLVVAAMGADMVLQGVGFMLLRNLDPALQPRRYLSAVASVFLMELSYAVPCLLIWQQDTEFAKAAAAGLLSMTLFQLSTVRAIHLPFGLAGISGGTLVALIGNGFYWLDSGHWLGFFISTVALLAAVTYAVGAMQSNHALHLEVSRRGIRADAANRAKGLFLAQMSHELRTPLNAIVGMGEAERAQTDDPAAQARMQTLIGSAMDLAAILDDIVQMSALEEHQLPLHPVIARPKEAIEATVALFQPVFANAGLWLRLEFIAKRLPDGTLAQTLPETAEFDPQRLRQCLSNLLSNALKFTETGGATLRVSYRPQSLRKPGQPEMGRLQIDVSDTGKGIAAHERDLVFQPFQRGAGTHAGSGLGLAISRGIALQMQGDLEHLPSTSGALFRLTLLIRPAVMQPPTPASQVDLAGRHILVVDDIATNRLVASTYLRGMSALAEEAPSGAAALQAIKARRPDLVLLDLHMPGLSGVETLAAIRALPGPHLPVVAMTAVASAADRTLHLSAGLDGYLTKPLTLESLRAGIAPHLPKRDTAP